MQWCVRVLRVFPFPAVLVQMRFERESYGISGNSLRFGLKIRGCLVIREKRRNLESRSNAFCTAKVMEPLVIHYVFSLKIRGSLVIHYDFGNSGGICSTVRVAMYTGTNLK